MAFTLSGTTIIQSGTDTSLAGLSGIAGVTTEIVGGVTVYRLGARQVSITGALTYDAKTQRFESVGATVSPVVNITSTGNLTINAVRNASGIDYPTYNDGFVTRPANNTIQTEFQVVTGGSFTCNGARVVVAGTGSNAFQAVVFQKGSILNITKGWISSSISNQIRCADGGSGDALQFNVNGLIVENMGFTIFSPFSLLSGLSSFQSTTQIVNAANFLLSDFNPITPTLKSVDNWNVVNLYMKNSVYGTGVVTTGGDANSNNNRWISITKDVVVNVKNSNNSPIENAVIYIRDTNNGARLNVSNIPNQLNDNIYIRSSAANGLTPTANVYIMHGKANTGIVQPTLRDYRSKTTVAGDDLFDIHTWSYGEQYRVLSNQSLKGAGTLTLIAELSPDTNVTLSRTNALAKLASSFIVDSDTNTITVTANSTLDDLYDAMKAFKTRAVAAQLEYPTIATQPVVASGTNLVTSMNIVGVEFLTNGTKFKTLQANATAGGTISNLSIVGDVSQTTPTNLSNVQISGTLTYNTNTATSIAISNGTTIGTAANSGTGIVTISRDNTSSITTYTDAEINFLDSSLSAVGITSATIYGSQSDRDTGANAGATFTTSLDFKYGSVVSGVTMQNTVYLRVVVGSVTLFAQITLVTGSNVLDLGVQGQLSAINAKVDLTAKQASLEIVNQGVQKASKIIPHNTNI